MTGLVLASLFGLAGCATDVQPPPKLFEVCQALDQSRCLAWAWAGEEITLRLVGSDLSQVWEVDLGNEDPPTARGSFRAWIGSLELDRVRRAEDPILGQQALIADLPAGLTPGFYPVEVETPGGQRAMLGGNAFELRDPLALQLSLDKAQLPRGDTARLTITVQNRGPAPIDRLALDLSQGGTGGFALPSLPATFSLQGQTEQDVTLDLVAGGPGDAELAVTATGLAAGWIPVGRQPPAVIEARILEQAALQLQAELLPASVSVGQPLELRVVVTNSGGVSVRQAQLTRPEVTGAGAVQWAFDPGQVLTIEPGAQVTFSWPGTAASAGTAWINASLSGLEAISQREVGVSLTSPIPLEILSR